MAMGPHSYIPIIMKWKRGGKGYTLTPQNQPTSSIPYEDIYPPGQLSDKNINSKRLTINAMGVGVGVGGDNTADDFHNFVFLLE